MSALVETALVQTTHLACPVCGSTKVTLDYDATVSLRVVDGVAVAVIVGGVIDSPPTNFFCEECDENPFVSDETTDAALGAAEATLPHAIEGDLSNGWYVFGSYEAGHPTVS